MLLKKTIFLTWFLFAFSIGEAQDVHWSQQEFGILQKSPAMVGSFKGISRTTAQYRNQWASVPVDFTTFAVAFEKKMPTLKGFKTALAGRLVSDKAGDAGLSWNQVELSGSASKQLSDIWTASIGLGASFGQRAFEIQNLSFRSQWNGDIFDETLPNGEGFARSSGIIPSLQAGFALHGQIEDSRNNAYIFTGIHNVNRPTVSFEDEASSRLPVRFNFGGWGVMQTSELTDLVIGSYFQKQDAYFESIVRVGGRYHLGVNGDNPTFLELMMQYRIGDAFIPSLRVDWNAWSIGLSYDYNTSNFDVATNSRGGFELGLQYRIVPVDPLPVKKACPIF